jgi:NADPH:quinone reductase-like Zn-dependent oxidoreductase
MSSTNDGSSHAATRAFWITAAGEGKLLNTFLDAPPNVRAAAVGAEVTVQSLYSGVSRGTESLVFHGRVPASEHQSMRAPFQQGDFPWPVKYGYANVGRVVSGPEGLAGKTVFCLYPHQQRYKVPASAVTPLPPGLPASRAILAANMETAVNGLWDAMPCIGDRIAVVGLGVVGLLVAWLASRIPGAQVVALDTNPGREAVARKLGLNFASQSSADDFDLVIHASGESAGLATALGLAGPEATVVEMSWYGDQPVNAPLGAAFHPRRLTLKSSQVGGINPLRQPRWNYRRRLILALDLLQDPVLDALISAETPFEQMPQTMARILALGNDTLCHRIRY